MFGEVFAIHLNPVRARLVPATQPGRYALSSPPKCPQGTKRSDALESEVGLGEAGELTGYDGGMEAPPPIPCNRVGV